MFCIVENKFRYFIRLGQNKWPFHNLSAITRLKFNFINRNKSNRPKNHLFCPSLIIISRLWKNIVPTDRWFTILNLFRPPYFATYGVPEQRMSASSFPHLCTCALKLFWHPLLTFSFVHANWLDKGVGSIGLIPNEVLRNLKIGLSNFRSPHF